MSKVALPSAKPPTLRWYFAYVRLVIARVLAKADADKLERSLALSLAMLFSWFGYEQLRNAPTPAPGAPHGAIIQIIIMIVIMIVAALVAYAMRPKPKDPDIIKANVPVVEDGKGIIFIFGEVWVDDSIVLGFKQMGEEPIKSKGGK